MLTKVQLGWIAAQLALEFPSWVERRIEHVSYLDRSTVYSAEGVMFRWPEKDFFPTTSTPQPGDVVYVPLDLLDKGSLAGLDGVRPDGSPFPILPYARSAELAYTGIVNVVWGQAERLGQSKLEPQTLEILKAIVSAPPDDAASLLNAALADPNAELAKVLRDDDSARGLLKELAGSVMLLVPAVYVPGEEVVYRYSYTQAVEVSQPWRKRTWARLRFQDMPVEREGLSFGWSKSYHLQVDVPAEVRVPRAQLRGYYGTGKAQRQPQLIAEADGNHIVDIHARRPTKYALERGLGRNPVSQPPYAPPLPERASTEDYLRAISEALPTPLVRADQGEAEIWFRLECYGTFLAAMVVSCVIVMMLILASLRLNALDGQAGPALLLALPVIALGYLTRPGEHSFATHLLVAIRLAALLVGVCSLLVASLLAGGFVHKRDAKGPGYACKAHVSDLNHHPPRGRGWRTVADPDISELHCRSYAARAGTSELNTWARDAAIGATALAGLLSLWLLLGWFYTRYRSSGMLPPAAGVPDKPPASAQASGDAPA